MEKLKRNDLKSNQVSCQACEDCGGTGWAESGNEYSKCKCRYEAYRATKAAKIPDLYKKESLSTYRSKDCLIMALGALEPEKATMPESFDISKNYFIAGALGAGKTHLLWSHYKAFTEKYLNVVYADAAFEMIHKYQQQKYKEDINEKDSYNFGKEGIHVFIDDIDKVKFTEDRSMMFFEIIDTLYRKSSGLTITSQFTLSEIEECSVFGEHTYAITRRIKDMCNLVYF